MTDIDNPAEVYERYLGRAIADPFTRVLLDCAGPPPGERVLDLAAGTGSVARYVAPIVGAEGRVVAVHVHAAMLAPDTWSDGERCVGTCRTRWEEYHKKKKETN